VWLVQLVIFFLFLIVPQELREKNWKAMEALEKAEKSAAEKVNKSDKSARVNTLVFFLFCEC
jgi:hypothetical protein